MRSDAAHAATQFLTAKTQTLIPMSLHPTKLDEPQSDVMRLLEGGLNVSQLGVERPRTGRQQSYVE